MKDVIYGITKNIGRLTIDAGVEKVTAALKSEGFGVLTEIDVKATMKKKLDVDVRPYKILGACNPPLAHRSLTEEPLMGLLLPCNVVVAEDEDGTIVVSAVKPSEMFKVVENAALADIAGDVEAKLTRVIDSL